MQRTDTTFAWLLAVVAALAVAVMVTIAVSAAMVPRLASPPLGA